MLIQKYVLFIRKLKPIKTILAVKWKNLFSNLLFDEREKFHMSQFKSNLKLKLNGC